MSDLYVICEGRAEQGFCNLLLVPHFGMAYNTVVLSRLVTHSTSGDTIHRGGVRSYTVMRKDIVNEMKRHQRRDVLFTTMFDLYKLPKDFPGKRTHQRDPRNPTPYVLALEQAFRDDVADERFIPYLQLHEYETLLFADPEAFRIVPECADKAVQQLQAIVAEFDAIERINDDNAPSKRIIEILPRYRGLKASAGPNIAQAIGLFTLRAKCPHFDAWLTKLEQACRPDSNAADVPSIPHSA